MSTSEPPEMDRQLIAPSMKSASTCEPNTGSSSSSSSLSSNRNRNRNNYSSNSSNNNQISVRNPNQNRRNQRPQSSGLQVPQSSTQNINRNHHNDRNNTQSVHKPPNNGARNHVTQRFNGHRKGPPNHQSNGLSKVGAKERFVQANCQFVMKSSLLQDYGPHLKDPDLPIVWDDVEEVIFKNAGDDQVCCPICLSDPVAAKITRCGHIYCWSCVLHYLALSDDPYRPCPICYERVRKNELKTATILQKVAFKKTDFMTFKLTKIAKGSTIALPADYELSDGLSMGRLGRNSDDVLNQVCKYFVSTAAYLEGLIVREETELFKQKLEYQNEQMPEVCFVEEALGALDERKGDLLQLDELAGELNALWNAERKLSSKGVQVVEWVYFYMSDDYQPIFLHPINVRMLKHEFGELKNCPASFSAKIIEILGANVNEELRRRNAHFRHLPLTCELKIAELEFSTSLVSQETLDHFAGEIAQRLQDRRRKAKKEQKRDRRIDAENHRKVFGVLNQGPEFDFDQSEFPTWNDFSSSPENSNSAALEQVSYPILSPSPTIPEPIVGDSWALPPLPGSSSSPPKEFQSSFASLLHGNNQFQASTPAKKGPNGGAGPSRVLEGANQTVTSMDMSMSDFLESCIKRGKPKKGKKGRKNSE